MTFIIAEAGVNHNGRLATAFRLCDAAKEAGADAVKFQHFSSQALWGDDRIAHLELRDAEVAVIAKHCASIGIEFMVTPFGVREVGVLNPLVKCWKIVSGCLKKTELLKAVSATGKPIIMSTGMQTPNSLWEAIAVLNNPKDLTVLHCTSAYPCPISDVNLKAMRHLPKPYGYSDHTLGITVPIAAVAMGATVIEKHLTLDRKAEGPDHKASIEPAEFRVMVSAIRTVEEALGDGVKRPQASERETMEAWYGQR